MSGERLSLVLAIALLLLWVGQARQGAGQLRASRTVAIAEGLAFEAAEHGRVAPARVEECQRLLREAADLDPAQVDVPVARAWQYLQLGRPQGAIRVLERALALEPRAEVYATFGQAQLMAGDREAAREAFSRALRLDPSLHDRLEPLLVQTDPAAAALVESTR